MANSLIFLLLLPVVLFLSWLEYRRPRKKRLLPRLIATCLLCVFLVLLLHPPSFKTLVRGRQSLIYLGEGYSHDSLSKLYAGLVGRGVKPGIINQKTVASPDLLLEGKYDTLHLLGYGMDETVLRQFDPEVIRFHPSVGEGITAVSWDRELHTGEWLMLHGVFENLSRSAVTLSLSGFGNAIDSVRVKPGKHAFTLQAKMTQSGRRVYTLLETRAKGRSNSYAVPVEVRDRVAPRILELQATPSFESKFFRRALGRLGFSFAFRYAVSKGVFETGFSKMPKFDLGRLSAGSLKHFNLLVCDETAYIALSAAEKAIIREALFDNRLGILFRLDTLGSQSHSGARAGRSYFGKKIAADGFKGNMPAHQVLEFSDHDRYLLSGSATSLRRIPTYQPLLSDDHDRVFAAKILAGEGSLVVSSFGTTFQLYLAGQDHEYLDLWLKLIEKALPAAVVNERLCFEPFGFVGKPLKVSYEVSGVRQYSGSHYPMIRTLTGEKIVLRESFEKPGAFEGTYWPTHSGWQAFTTNFNGVRKQYWTYVLAKGAWNSAIDASLTRNTAAYLSPSAGKRVNQIQRLEFLRLKRIWFYIPILLCLIYLYTERKIN